MRFLAPISTGVFALAVAVGGAPQLTAAEASGHHGHRHSHSALVHQGASTSGDRGSTSGSTQHSSHDSHAQDTHTSDHQAGADGNGSRSGDHGSAPGDSSNSGGGEAHGTTPTPTHSNGPGSDHTGSGTNQTGSGHTVSGTGHGGTGHGGTTDGHGGTHGSGSGGGALPVSPLAPVLGHRVAIAPAPGKPGQPPAPPALIRLPHSRQIVPLTSVSALPVGTVIDARTGAVTLVSATTRSGETQGATFWGGIFTVQQGPHGMTNITPVHGSFVGCTGHTAVPSGSSATTSGHARGRLVRSLWASDNHGKFRTHGRNSVATVRGTVWVTVETCDGTTTYVLKGEVAVRDRNLHRTAVVTAGHHYFARSAQ